jgi:outer membrane protein assembly factor BamB
VSGDGGAVVFGASDGNLYAVRAADGAKLWSIRLGGQVTGSPTLVGDRIYVTTRRGGLWALTTAPAPQAEDAAEHGGGRRSARTPVTRTRATVLGGGRRSARTPVTRTRATPPSPW